MTILKHDLSLSTVSPVAMCSYDFFGRLEFICDNAYTAAGKLMTGVTIMSLDCQVLWYSSD